MFNVYFLYSVLRKNNNVESGWSAEDIISQTVAFNSAFTTNQLPFNAKKQQQQHYKCVKLAN